MKLFFSVLLIAALGSPLWAQQEHTITLVSGGVERTFLLHLPAAAPEAGLPLLLCYHGAGGASRLIEQVTGFSDLADEYNFIVAYPQAVRINNVVQWNAYVDNQPGHGGVGDNEAPDDVQFALDVIDYIAEQYAIDSDRVYATGLSSGGFMSYGLAVMSPPGTVQAIAPVAANMWGDETYITQLALAGMIPDMPVMHIHGTDDNIVPYIDPDDTPQDYGEYPLFLFSRLCGVHTYSSVEPVMENVDKLVFCKEPYDIAIIRIRGMEHSWTNGSYPTSRAILEFFGLADVQTAVAERESTTCTIAPNPTADVLYITVPEPATIELYSMPGRLVYRAEVGSGRATIPCVDLSSGVYTVWIQMRDRLITRSVVISK